jgi:hypothetical protein
LPSTAPKPCQRIDDADHVQLKVRLRRTAHFGLQLADIVGQRVQQIHWRGRRGWRRFKRQRRAVRNSLRAGASGEGRRRIADANLVFPVGHDQAAHRQYQHQEESADDGQRQHRDAVASQTAPGQRPQARRIET